MPKRVIPTLTTYAELDAYLGNKTDRPAPLGSGSTSVRIVRDLGEPKPSISVVYHQTPVLTFAPDNSVRVWANGWATKTTASVIERHLPTLRLSVARYDVPSIKTTHRFIMSDGTTLIGQDRSGRGDVFRVFTTPRRNADYSLHYPAGHDSSCGTCHRTWSSVETPTPSARCPFEYEHTQVEWFDARTDVLVIGDDRYSIEREARPFSMATYPCRCKMCEVGASSWQEARALGVYGSNVFAGFAR